MVRMREAAGSSRRAFLRASGVTATTVLAGCNIPFVGSEKLPPLTNGWADVRRDGTVGLVLRFDGDIQGMMDKYSVSVTDILAGLEENGYPVSNRRVSIRGTEQYPEEQTISAVISNLVTPTNSWPAGTRYAADNGFFLQRTIKLKGGKSVQVPVSKPSFILQFPNGYRYKLPRMDRMVTNTYKVKLNRSYRGLFKYGDYPRNRTVPVVQHHDPAVASEAHAFDAYRIYVLDKFEQLTDVSKYEEEFYSEFKQAVTDLGFEMGWEGATQFNPLKFGFFPEVLGHLISIHSALNQRRDELISSLESLSQWALAVENDNWMRPLNSDLGSLRMNAEIGFRGMNPAWVTAPSRRLSKARLNDYISLLESQHSNLQKYASGEFREGKTVFSGNSNYFSNLFDIVVSTLRAMYNRINDVMTELRTIESAL